MPNMDQPAIDLAKLVQGAIDRLEIRVGQMVQPPDNHVLLNEIRRAGVRGAGVLPIRQPTLFSGSLGENFSEWVEKLEKFMTLNGITVQDDEMRQAFLEAHLNGSASAIHDDIKRRDKPPDYVTLKRLLIEHFPEGRDSDVHQQLLIERKQKRNETVNEFIATIRKLARSAYPQLTEDSRCAIVKPIFLRGICPEIREGMKFREFSSLDEALKAAVYIESQLEREERNQSREYINTVTNFSVQAELNSMKQQLSELQSMLKSQAVNHGRQNMKPALRACDHCGKTNHPSEKCFHRPKTEDKCQICGSTYHVTKNCTAPCKNCSETGHKTSRCQNPRRCNSCGQTGHISYTCPKKNSKTDSQSKPIQINSNKSDTIFDIDNDDPNLHCKTYTNRAFIGSVDGISTVTLQKRPMPTISVDSIPAKKIKVEDDNLEWADQTGIDPLAIEFDDQQKPQQASVDPDLVVSLKRNIKNVLAEFDKPSSTAVQQGIGKRLEVIADEIVTYMTQSGNFFRNTIINLIRIMLIMFCFRTSQATASPIRQSTRSMTQKTSSKSYGGPKKTGQTKINNDQRISFFWLCWLLFLAYYLLDSKIDVVWLKIQKNNIWRILKHCGKRIIDYSSEYKKKITRLIRTSFSGSRDHTREINRKMNPTTSKSVVNICPITEYGLRTPHVVANINSLCKVSAMIDTGAVFSLLDADIAKRIKNLEILHTDVQPVAANGQPIKLIGAAFVTIQIADIQETILVHIQNCCSAQLILGTNFLGRFSNVLFNWKNSTIHMNGNTVPCDGMVYNPPINRGAICLESDILIDPRSITRFNTQVPTMYHNTNNVIFTPDTKFTEKNKVYFAASIARPKDGKIILQVMNPTEKAVKLYAKMCVGEIKTYTDCNSVTNKPDARIQNENCGGFRNWLEKNIDASDEIEKKDRKKLIDILEKFPNLYATDAKETGRTNLIEHQIHTGDSMPIRKRPFRISPKEREMITDDITELENKGIIRKSKSPWGTNIVLVMKKDGSRRMCMDFRSLNTVTKKDVYPLPRIDEILDVLQGMKFFTSLDQANAYWAIPISENDREKTAFVSPSGLYEFNYLPFGLCNAPATFQRLMDVLLSGLQWETCLVYLDDILIFGKTHDIMLERLQEVLKRLDTSGIKLRLNKCKFSATKIAYLGHVISEEGVSTDPQKTQAVANIPTPTDKRAVKSFLGLVSYYRRFIKNCSSIANPLVGLLKKNKEFSWNNEQENAFQELKNALTSAPILSHPNFQKPFILQTDASGAGIGAVLSQIDDDGKEHPVAYASRTLKPAEKNYPITELETLAVVEFVKYFRAYLFQQDVIVETDHTAVKAVLEKSNSNPRIARWGLALSGINLDVRPKKGNTNKNADALSRTPDKNGIAVTDIDTEIINRPENVHEQLPVGKYKEITYVNSIQVTDSQLLHAQNQDAFASKIIENIEKMRDTNELDFFLKNGLLHKKCISGEKLYVPETYRSEIITAYHADELAGHFNHKKTSYLIRQKYYWPTMHREVRLFCKNCENCQKNKHMTHKNIAKLQAIQVRGPFDRVGVDCMGPLTLSDSGNKYIVVFIDYFTKYIEAFATSDITAQTIAKLFVQKIVCRHGAPTILQSDRGTDFTSKLMHEISKLMDTQQLHTTAYHPMCNGEVERANQTLIVRIRMYVDKGHADWDIHLPFAVFSTNINENESTRYSPFELMFARQPRLPIDAALNYQKPLHMIDSDDYANEVKTHFTMALTTIQKILDKAQGKYTDQYNKKAVEPNYKVGDLVLKDIRSCKRGLTTKLLPKYEGPFRIIEINYPNVRIQCLKNPKSLETLHVNRTRKFHVENDQIKKKENKHRVKEDEEIIEESEPKSQDGRGDADKVPGNQALKRQAQTSSEDQIHNSSGGRYNLRQRTLRTRTFDL